jgi:hypothetical protein
MRKRNPQSPGDGRSKSVPSVADETFLADAESAARRQISPKSLSWSPQGGQVTGNPLNAGPEPPSPPPTAFRGEPKAPSPPSQGSGAIRHGNREVVGDQQKSAPPAADETLLTEQQLANRWQISPKSLRNARVAGRLVGFVRIGRSIRYKLSEIAAYELQNSVRSTSGGGAE